MFLNLGHTKTPLFRETKSFVLDCYKISRLLPNDERYNLVQQIRRAALPVHLNYAEGCSRHSTAERKRYYEMSRGSLIEVDAAIDVAIALNFLALPDLEQVKTSMLNCFAQLSALIKSCTTNEK